MRRIIESIAFFSFASLMTTSCATITGSPRYFARVLVREHPKAEIFYKEQFQGRGTAVITVDRKQANKFSLVIKEKDCREQAVEYKSRSFRGWALFGNFYSWSLVGIVVDFSNGSFWKPNVKEWDIRKLDNKNFQYFVNYTGCEVKEEPADDTPVDVLYLRNGSIIKGTLMEPDSPAQIKIQIKDGSIFVFKLDEVLKVE
jgi:hypothetical protein